MKVIKRKIIKSALPNIGLVFSWRLTWYSVVIWLLAIIISGFVILPWFYLALPIAFFWLTILYFKNGDKTLRAGLLVSLSWFLVVVILDFVEIIGPYYANAQFYFSDFRHWLKYPLILLMPVVYSLFLENFRLKNHKIH